MVHDQEPGIINPYLSTGNGYVNQLTIGPTLAAGAIYNEKAQLVPYLMESVPKLVKAEPLTVTAKFKQSAVWSDGKPITSRDFIATWRTLMNPNWDITSREGWEDIQRIVGNGKSSPCTSSQSAPTPRRTRSSPTRA